MVELRKRKAPAGLVRPGPTKKRSTQLINYHPKAKASIPTENTKLNDSFTPQRTLCIGDTISLETFGGQISTHEGNPITLKELVSSSKSGVVLFTYPKASTPGCTNQVRLFRDGYEKVSSTGLSIFGLSADSPKANANFKSKQNLPYSLLCDPTSTLISAIGFKRVPRGTMRGVFAVDKVGKVLLLETGGPAATINAVRKLAEAAAPLDSGTADEESGEAHDGITCLSA